MTFEEFTTAAESLNHKTITIICDDYMVNGTYNIPTGGVSHDMIELENPDFSDINGYSVGDKKPPYHTILREKIKRIIAE